VEFPPDSGMMPQLRGEHDETGGTEPLTGLFRWRRREKALAG